MHDASLQSCLERQLNRHLDHAALSFQLDGQLVGDHHGLSWSDFVLLSVLDGAAGGTKSSRELAARLGLTPSRLVLQLLPLEKTGLVARDAPAAGSSVTLRPSGRRVLGEARDTAEAVCAEADRLRDPMPSRERRAP